MATLVSGQHGKLRPELFKDVDEEAQPRLQRLVALLRLATLFKYVEELEQLPDFLIQTTEKTLSLEFPSDWLTQHPLTWQELEQQKDTFKRLGMRLEFA
jgi:exopolyphosphatase/guanosine-5'-triphosphate,3'-diphosphate pyrophosphatase